MRAAAADTPQGSSFDLRQPQGLPDLVWRHPRGPPSASNLRKAAAAWRALLEQQYAQLQVVADQVDSFSADSWELFGSDDVPLRLADFLALLPPDRLASVALRLHPDEALPGAALCALRPYHHLRDLCIKQLEADRDWGPQQSPELKQRDDAAAAELGALTQLRSLCIVRDGIPAAAVVACRQLTALTSLVLDDSRGRLQGTSGLTALQALSHLELHQPENDFADPLPAPAAFPALDSFWYSVPHEDPYSLLLAVSLCNPSCFHCGPAAAIAGLASLPAWRCFTAGMAHTCAALLPALQELADDARERCFYPGVCSISFKDGTLRLEGIFDEMHPFERIADHVLPEGAHLRALELAAGNGFGELDDMDWTCSRLLSVTALAVDRCSIGRLPALLAQMPRLETLALTHCRGDILFAEEDDDFHFVDCTTVLAALPSLPRLTQLSLTAREDCTLARLDSFPPLPGAAAGVMHCSFQPGGSHIVLATALLLALHPKFVGTLSSRRPH